MTSPSTMETPTSPVTEFSRKTSFSTDPVPIAGLSKRTSSSAEMKVSVMNAELAILRSRLSEEGKGRIAAEEKSGRGCIENQHLKLLWEKYSQCYQVRRLAGDVNFLATELMAARAKIGNKSTIHAGTDPPHHPVGRTAIPLSTMSTVTPPTVPLPSSPQQGNQFSPQRYREPDSYNACKQIMDEVTQYIHNERTKPSKIPIPTWVISRGSTTITEAAILPKENNDQADTALSRFLSEVHSKTAIYSQEVDQKKATIKSLSQKTDTLNTKTSLQPAVRGSNESAMARVKQKLVSLRDDIIQTTEAFESQRSAHDSTKADLTSAKIELASSKTGVPPSQESIPMKSEE